MRPTLPILGLLTLGVIAAAVAARSASSAPSAPPARVAAVAETDPVPDADDAADDPAIWVNRAEPARSRIIGTNKKGGLAVYDLDGQQVQYLPVGRVNNVDIRTGFPLAGKRVPLVAASHRDDKAIRLWIGDDASGALREAPGRSIPVSVEEPYGLAMYTSAASGKTFVFVNDKTGRIEQWLLQENAGVISGSLVRTLKLDGQVEGMFADDELGHLFVGEETRGVWRFGAEPDAPVKGVLIDQVIPKGNITPDVEGISMWKGEGGEGYLIVSSQGSNQFMIYARRPPNDHKGSFTVIDGPSVDGVSETDGIDVTSESLGGAFPCGLIVVQDGVNHGHAQNFKLVAPELVGRAFRPPLNMRR